jgi:hypothetical protein
MDHFFQNLFTIDALQQKCCISLDKLVSLPILIPEIQREIDDKRVEEIISFQRDYFEKYKTFCYIGDITLAKTDDNFIILDGFHRFSSMKHIYLLKPTYNVGITILNPSVSLSIQDIFILLNKAEPVPHFIMQTTMDTRKRHILENFSKQFNKHFKIYISKSKNPHRPNINLDMFLSKLVDSEIFKMTQNVKELLDYFSFLNIHKWKDMDQKNTLISIEKASKHANQDPLYITNDIDNAWIPNKNWISEFYSQYTLKLTLIPRPPTEDMPSLKKRRKTFPKTMRMMLWSKYFPDNTMLGKCSCCQSQVDYNLFELGHIISVLNGGTNTLENLVPICGMCNKSCGGKNLTDFCTDYKFPLHII